MNIAVGLWTWTRYPDMGLRGHNIIDKIFGPVEDCQDACRNMTVSCYGLDRLGERYCWMQNIAGKHS